MKKQRLLFLTLKVFSATGGIEKVSRVAAKALWELCGEQGQELSVFAAWDRQADLDPRYLPQGVFWGFGRNKLTFVQASIRQGQGAAVVLLSHANLLPVGWAIKKASPKTKLVLLAHGIEVWSRLPVWKRALLRSCDRILPVSRFTAGRLQEVNGVDPAKLRVLNNGLDPFLPPPVPKAEAGVLLERYGFTPENKVLLTITRLAHGERYKGYDEVLMAMKRLKGDLPGLRYLVVGRYDEKEKARLDRLVHQQGLEGEVVFAGFVPDEELPLHFALADAYVMPSRGEGFGITFIEALFYGLPVIAGSVDGSADALADGDLGTLVDPGSPASIGNAIRQLLLNREGKVPSQAEVLQRFGFPAYKEAWRMALQPLLPAGEQPGEKRVLCTATRSSTLVNNP